VLALYVSTTWISAGLDRTVLTPLLCVFVEVKVCAEALPTPLRLAAMANMSAMPVKERVYSLLNIYVSPLFILLVVLAEVANQSNLVSSVLWSSVALLQYRTPSLKETQRIITIRRKVAG
jgi:hypothetical protein